MKAIRKIIDANQLSSIIDLPDTMRNQKVEIIILPTTENIHQPQSMKGILKKYANPKLIAQEKSAWENAIIKKYDHLK